MDFQEDFFNMVLGRVTQPTSTVTQTKENHQVESSPEIEFLEGEDRDDMEMASQREDDQLDGLSDTTLELPGLDEPKDEKPKVQPSKSPPPPNMRALYWEVVHEAQTRIRKENPDLKAKEILKLAREEWLGRI